jgi:hypothetical protein
MDWENSCFEWNDCSEDGASFRSKCNAPYLSYNATESRENVSERCMGIKISLLEVLTDVSFIKGSVELLLKEIEGRSSR